MNEFKLSMTLAAEGKVVGSYESSRGNGTFEDGKFDAEKKSFTASIDTGRGDLSIRSKLEDGKLKGQIEMFGGRFEVAFEAAPRPAPNTHRPRHARGPEAPAAVSSLAVLPALGQLHRDLALPPRSRLRRLSTDPSDDDEPYVFVSEAPASPGNPSAAISPAAPAA